MSANKAAQKGGVAAAVAKRAQAEYVATQDDLAREATRCGFSVESIEALVAAAGLPSEAPPVEAAAATGAAAPQEGAGPVSYELAPGGARDYADDMPHNLYAVIYPGRFLTAAIIEMGTDPEEKTVAGSILWTAYEASTYTERGIPDFARIRRFGSALSGAVNDICRSLTRNLTAVLVRTPPPAAVFASAASAGAAGGCASSTEHLQCNTYFEGFAVGMLYGLYPHTPTWYCHPNAIRALFSTAGDEALRTWSSREEESADIMAMAMDVVGKPLRHDREAGCVLAAVHHYIKFAKAGFAERPRTVEQVSSISLSFLLVIVRLLMLNMTEALWRNGSRPNTASAPATASTAGLQHDALQRLGKGSFQQG